MRIVWASCGHGLEPSRAWVAGYEYVAPSRFAPGRLLLRHVGGAFDGCLVNYRPEDVSPDELFLNNRPGGIANRPDGAYR